MGNKTSYNSLLNSSFKELKDLWVKTQPVPDDMAQINRELTKKGCIFLHPKAYWGDEWFSPSESTSISVPFYLAHSKLKKLEKKMIGFAEGETKKERLKLLRHEVGHCFDHAYKTSSTKEWKSYFGDPKKAYKPEDYKADPNSIDYVKNLEDHYSQSHPLEDFAETFAVWLNPKSQWRKKYKNQFKAIEKLNYIDRLVKKHGNLAPKVGADTSFYAAKNLRIKLKTYYNRKRRSLNIQS